MTFRHSHRIYATNNFVHHEVMDQSDINPQKLKTFKHWLLDYYLHNAALQTYLIPPGKLTFRSFKHFFAFITVDVVKIVHVKQ